jgi:hypothetical protein
MPGIKAMHMPDAFIDIFPAEVKDFVGNPKPRVAVKNTSPSGI